MPSPRPRILGSPRVRNRDPDRNKNPQSPAAPTKIHTSDEPDCEIIKIDDDEAESEPPKASNGSVTIEVSREQPRQRIGVIELVEQCPMRLQEEFNVSSNQSVVAPVSPSLALQFVPDTSTSTATHARNIYSRQNVVMVLPVNTVSQQVFKAPTLCTLERIENLTEIKQIEQVVATQTGNLVSPINDIDARTMKARRDAKRESHELRKQLLQQIFKNDTTDKTTKSNASSLTVWRSKKGSNEKFNNRAGLPRNVDSSKLAETTNSMSKGSNVTGSGSVKIEGVIVATSNESTSTRRLVGRTESGSPLSGRTGNIKFLGNRSGAVSQSNAPSSRVDTSDIQDCFVSIANNPSGKSKVSGRMASNCLSKVAPSSTSSTDKQNGVWLRSRERTIIKSFVGNSERPVPPLTMIADKTKLYEEPIELISLSQESSDGVCLLEIKEESISDLNKPAESILTSENKKASSSESKNPTNGVSTSENRIQSISAQKKPVERLLTSENKKPIPKLKEVIVSIIPLEMEKDPKSSAPIIVDYSSTTAALHTTELSSQNDKRSSSPEETNKNANKDLDVTIDTSSCKSVDSASRKPRCTACKEKFSDLTELHRHATLSHQGVQIVFCDLCSDSFLTDRELQQHRLANCERDVSIDDKTLETPMEDENDASSPNSQKGESIPVKKAPSKRGRPPKRPRAPIDTSPGHSLSPKKRPRGRPRKKIIVNDEKSKNRSEHFPVCPDSISVEKRIPPIKTETPIVKRSYVEKDVVGHSAAMSNEKFKGAEIKKLVVLLTRLGGPVLDKYLEKLDTRPVVSFDSENPSRIENFRRIEGKRRVSPRQSKKIANLRRGMRKRSPSLKTKKFRNTHRAAANKTYSKDDDSESDDIPSSDTDFRKNRETAHVDLASGIYSDSEENTCSDREAVNIVSKTDSKTIDKETARSPRTLYVGNSVENYARTDDRMIIRKSTSRSSAVGVAALEKNRTTAASISLTKESKNREKKSSTTSTPIFRDLPVSEEKPSMQREEKYSPPEEERIESSDSKVSKASSVLQILPRKTCPPSNRDSKVATKSIQKFGKTKRNATKVQDLCRMCDEFLKKRLADQFGDRKTRRTSLACPFCDMHFITMFYLEKHVARKHLNCKSEPQCGRSKNSVDVKLECETEGDHSSENSDEARPKNPWIHRSDVEGTSRSMKIKRILESSLKQLRASRKQDLRRTVDESTIDENSMENLPSIQCWVCDLNFNDLSTCNHHMREVHEVSKSSTKNGRCARSAKITRAASSNIKILPSESAGSVGKAVSSPKSKLSARDQTIVDREYLLKQLLSDDSTDGFDENNEYTVGDVSREVTIDLIDENVKGSSEKKVIGLMSSAHTCRICSKQFNRTQDLLMHNLLHETEDEPIDEKSNLPKSPRTENSPQRFSGELFMDPSTSDDRMDVESNPTHELKIGDNRSGCVTPNNDRSLGEDFFASNSELDSDDFAFDHKLNAATERVVIGEKRTTDMHQKKPENSSDKKPANSSKKPRFEKIVPAVSQQDNERRCTLREFLDTEKGLANADVTNTNDRMPIECGKCNRQFPSQSALNEHLFFLHDDSLKDTVLTDVLKIEEKSVRKWHCSSCRQDFKQLQRYGRHCYKMHGDDSMVHVCENCCKILTTVTMVNVHICTDVASYNCRTCQETFPTGMSLRLHNTEKHMETDEPNVCEPCNKKFLTKSMLTRHEKSRHRFLRPYRPRKRSPVMMAEHDDVDNEKSSNRTLLESENFTLYSDVDEDDVTDLKLNIYHRKSSTFSTSVQETGQRKRSRERPEGRCDSSNETNFQDSGFRASEKSSDTTNYIDEMEIHQCCLCRIYCLTKPALDNHMKKIHSGALRVCQLCRKTYAKGGLIRHVVDEHVSPCETYEENVDSIWNFGANVKDRDTELFVRILGMKRLLSMSDYHVSDESAGKSSINCPMCEMNFSTTYMYRFHFLMNHDSMCVLCNIEFKSGEDAAKHKKEEHRSASCYIWFVDRILRDVTAVKDFQKVVERSFIEMISRDTPVSDEENRDSFDAFFENKEPKFSEDLEKDVTKVENNEDDQLDENATFSEDSKVEEADDDKEDIKFMLVVTDEDLDKYDIGKRYPNIWGLASKISSTCEQFTPKDVKEMLETYFEI